MANNDATTSAATYATPYVNIDKFDLTELFRGNEVLDIKETKIGYDIVTKGGTYKLRKKAKAGNNKFLRYMKKMFNRKKSETIQKPKKAPFGVYGIYDEAQADTASNNGNEALYWDPTEDIIPDNTTYINQGCQNVLGDRNQQNNLESVPREDVDDIYEPCEGDRKMKLTVSSKALRRSPPTLPRRNTCHEISASDIKHTRTRRTTECYDDDESQDDEYDDEYEIYLSTTPTSNSSFDHLAGSNHFASNDTVDRNDLKECADSMQTQHENSYEDTHVYTSGRQHRVNENVSICQSTVASDTDNTNLYTKATTSSSHREERIRNLYHNIKSNPRLLPRKERLPEPFVWHNEEGLELTRSTRDTTEYLDKLTVNPTHQPAGGHNVTPATSTMTPTMSRHSAEQTDHQRPSASPTNPVHHHDHTDETVTTTPSTKTYTTSRHSEDITHIYIPMRRLSVSATSSSTISSAPVHHNGNHTFTSVPSTAALVMSRQRHSAKLINPQQPRGQESSGSTTILTSSRRESLFHDLYDKIKSTSTESPYVDLVVIDGHIS